MASSGNPAPARALLRVVTIAVLERSADDADEGGAGEESGGGPLDRPMAGLLMAQPNPFTPSTLVRFVVPRDGVVNLTVFDVAGRPVRTLSEGFHAAGEYRITWDGARRDGGRLTPGVYLVRLEVGDFAASEKIVMLK